MSRSRSTFRRPILAVLTLLAAAGLIATSGPAGAIPFEGDRTLSSCVRIVPIPRAAPAGSTLFVSHAFAAVLVPRPDC
jgi:hypothetical protein